MKTYVINISYFCNNNCRFCYNFGGRNIKPKLSIKKIKKEIKQAKENGYKTIALFGGEPTIHPNFFEILDFIDKNNLRIRIETNGRMFFYLDFCKKISKYKIDFIQISIHGHDSKIHDWVTQIPNSFNQTIKGIMNIKKLMPKTEIVSYTVINKKNYEILLEIVKFVAENLKIKFFNISFIDVSGRAMVNGDSLVEFEKVRPYLIETFDYLKEMKNNNKISEFFIEKGPICIIPKYYQNYRFEPGLLKKNYIKNDICGACNFNKNCSGFSAGYVKLFNFNGQQLNGFSIEDLKYFFSGLDIKNLPESKKFVKFDEFNNPIFVPNKNLKKKSLNELKKIAKKFGILILLYKKKKINVFNDPEIKIPDEILKFSKTASKKDLINALKNQINNDFNQKIFSKNIILTTGTRHSLFLIFLSLIKPGDEVIIQQPCWDGYKYGVDNVGGIARIIRKNIDIEEIERKINKKTKAILITNPYLSDFNALTLKKIKLLINLCKKFDLYLIFDEIVNRYLPKPVSALKICNIEKDPVIIVNSFSKNYFMPFYRSGFLIANKKIKKAVEKIIKVSDFDIAVKSVNISYAILNNSQKWCDKLRKKIYEKGGY